MAYIELISAWIEAHLDHEMAIAEIGMWIIGLYLMIFLILAIARGKFRPVRDGKIVHIGPMLVNWLKVPAIFMVLGLFGMLVYATCAENYPSNMECGPREEFCVECATGIVVVTRHGFEYDIHWLATLANAYGMGVISIQMFLAPIAGTVAIIGILYGIFYGIWKFVMLPLFRLFGLAASFIWRQLRKIPIRL